MEDHYYAHFIDVETEAYGAIALELASTFETRCADSRATVKLSQVRSNFRPSNHVWLVFGSRISSMEVTCEKIYTSKGKLFEKCLHAFSAYFLLLV